MRRPRSSRRVQAFALGAVAIVALVAALLLSRAAPATAGRWSYSQLLSSAQAGQVREVVITGSEAIASDAAGRKWSVALPGSTDGTSDLLRRAGVTVVSHASDPLAKPRDFVGVGLTLALSTVASLALLAAAVYLGVRFAWRFSPPQGPA